MKFNSVSVIGGRLIGGSNLQTRLLPCCGSAISSNDSQGHWGRRKNTKDYTCEGFQGQARRCPTSLPPIFQWLELNLWAHCQDNWKMWSSCVSRKKGKWVLWLASNLWQMCLSVQPPPSWILFLFNKGSFWIFILSSHSSLFMHCYVSVPLKMPFPEPSMCPRIVWAGKKLAGEALWI